jgi:VanZ family protein
MRDRAVGFYGLTFPLGPMIVSSWSILDESLQLFSPNRSFSFADMAANLIGIWLFYVIYHYGIKRKAMA